MLFLMYLFLYEFCLLCFQASGVTVSDVCKTTYEEIKKDKKHRYVVFFIRDEKQIDVEVIGKTRFSYVDGTHIC
jgi:cofilin